MRMRRNIQIQRKRHSRRLMQSQKTVLYTTSGGYIGEYNMGYDYIKALCKLYFGITDTECISAEGLDIFGNDTEKILAEKIRSL